MSALTTRTSGLPTGPTVPTVLLLHDRYGDCGDLDDARACLVDVAHVVEVRSARTQMAGCGIHGHYWFLGPPDRPELTTFGDGLYQLEALLVARARGGGVGLLGMGEGGTMALTLALVWPELVGCVSSIGGPLPESLDVLPLESREARGLRALLVPVHRSLEPTRRTLALRGASVELWPAACTQAAAAEWLRAPLQAYRD